MGLADAGRGFRTGGKMIGTRRRPEVRGEIRRGSTRRILTSPEILTDRRALPGAYWIVYPESGLPRHSKNRVDGRFQQVFFCWRPNSCRVADVGNL